MTAGIHRRLLGGLLLLVTVAPHAPFLAGGCLTDDFIHIALLQRDFPDFASVWQRPDAFGYFRPLVQSSYLLESRLWGNDCGVGYRVVNLSLHVLAVFLSMAIATRVLQSTWAGFLTAALFAASPKAATIAVFWISARAELLMTAFVFAASFAWMGWLRTRRLWLFAVSVLCYGVACLSKETAVAFPLALVFLSRFAGGFRDLTSAAAAFAAVAASVLLLRIHADAMSIATVGPTALELSPWRWLRNLWNYIIRAVPVALAAIAAGSAIARVNGVSGLARFDPTSMRVAAFGIAWFLAFIVLPLPLPLRSEIRLYLPSFGIAIAAAAVLRHRFERVPAVRIAVVVVIAAAVVYQGGRSARAHDNAVFASRFVARLQAAHEMPSQIAIVPVDRATHQRLRDSIGDYGDFVLRLALGESISGSVLPFGAAPVGGAQRVCVSSDGNVRRC